MKKICIATGFNKLYYDIASITIPNFLDYCSKHNIDLHISTKSYVPEIYNWSWNKYSIISNIIDKYDWIVWVDIDCLFINKDKNLCSLIDDNYSLIVGENKNPPYWYTEDVNYIENGVFLIKNDLFGKMMLRDFKNGFIDHPWHDQYKMIRCLRNNNIYNTKTKRLDLIDINAIDDFKFKKENVFIYHVAGGSSKTLQQKIELLKMYE